MDPESKSNLNQIIREGADTSNVQDIPTRSVRSTTPYAKGSSFSNSKLNLETFEVYLINRYRARKKRYLVVDVVARTLSRSNRDEITEPLSAGSSGSTASNVGNLRKTVPITPMLLLLPSETDKRKLKLFVEPQSRGLDIIFSSASERERFSALLRHVRAHSIQYEYDSFDSTSSLGRDMYSGAAPPRLNVLCTTFNCSKNPAPHICRGNDALDSGSVCSSFHEVSDSDYEDLNEQSGKFALSEHASLPAKEALVHQGPEVPDITEDTLKRWICSGEGDLYFIALQECKSKFLSDWIQLFMNELGPDQFTILGVASMWSIHGILITRVSLRQYFSHLRTDTRACGLGGMIGNKGAVGISVRYGDGVSTSSTSFAFVNSHLAARAERVSQRASDYQEICHSLLTTRKGQGSGVQLLHAYDHIFWAGDLNYRLDMGDHGSDVEFDHVVSKISSADDEIFAKLRDHDQLDHERAKHNVFVGFREGELTFPPTYRLEMGQRGVYSNKRNQNPSWTDRVLWRSRPGVTFKVELIDYTCMSDVLMSDHRPVLACFSVLTEAALFGSPQGIEPGVESEIIGSASPSAISDNTPTAQTSQSAPSWSSRPSAIGRNAPLQLSSLHQSEPSSEKSQVQIYIGDVEFFCKHVDAQQEAAMRVLNDPAFLEKTRSAALSNLEEVSDAEDDDIDSDMGQDQSHHTPKQREPWGCSKVSESHKTEAKSDVSSISSTGSTSSSLSRKSIDSCMVSSRRQRPKRSRQNSYYRPLHNSMGTKNSLFTGYGFAGGSGKIDSEGASHCDKSSSEFSRYVTRSNLGVHSGYTRVSMRFHSSILEAASQSVAVLGHCEQGYVRFHWPDANVSSLEPFLTDPVHLIDQQIIVTLYRTSNFRQDLIGQAQIPLRSVVQNKNSWFAVPVLLNGLPAGILRGNLFNPRSEEMVEQLEDRRSLSCLDSRPTLPMLPNLASIGSLNYDSPAEDSIIMDATSATFFEFDGVDQARENLNDLSESVKEEEEEEEDDDDDGKDKDEDCTGLIESTHRDDCTVLAKDASTKCKTPNTHDITTRKSSRMKHRSTTALHDADGAGKSICRGLSDQTCGEEIDYIDTAELKDKEVEETEANSETITRKRGSLAKSLREQRASQHSSGSRTTARSSLSRQDVAKHSKKSPTKETNDSSPQQRTSWLSRTFQRSKREQPNDMPKNLAHCVADENEPISYANLLSHRFELGLDQAKLETYLSDEEFHQVFQMTREKFNALPHWMQIRHKKQVNLF